MKASIFCLLSTVSAIASVDPTGDAKDWTNSTPSSLKTPVPVVVEHNPFQPAVASSTISFVNRDEVSLKLQAAMEGKVASVVRGTTPAVMIAGRLFRLGDEIYEMANPNGGVGALRKQSFLPGCRVTLKAINSDHLRVQVENMSPDKPSVLDASYRLDPKFIEQRSR